MMMSARGERTVAAATALMLLLVTFSGLGVLLWTAGPVDASGGPNSDDWLITGHESVSSDRVVHANITIVDGGTLTVKDSTLSMASTNSSGVNALTITVGQGGALVLDNARLEAYTYTFESMPVLGVLVENGGELRMHDSEMAFAGHLVLDNARMEMHSSVIKGLEEGSITNVVNNTLFPAADFTHSPVFSAFSSEVVMVSSSIEDMYQGGAATAGAYDFNYPFAKDSNDRVTVSYALNRYAAAANTDHVGNMSYEDGRFVVLEDGENLSVDGFDPGGLIFDAGEHDLKLNVLYRTDKAFDDATELDVTYGRDGDMSVAGQKIESTWTLDDKSPTTLISEDIPDYSSIELSTLEVFIDNTDLDGEVDIERLWLSIEDIDIDSYRKITMAGNSEFVAVDSTLPINYNDTDEEHNSLVMRDASQAHLYGVTAADPGDEPYNPAIESVDRTVTVRPLNQTDDDDTGEDIGDLMLDDGETYDVAADDNTMSVLMNLTGLPEGLVDSWIRLNSSTSSNYEQGPVLQFKNEYGIFNTTIQPEESESTIHRYDMGGYSIQNLTNTEFIFSNDINGSAMFDSLILELTYQPQAFIYKWANITLQNSLDEPIANVAVNAHEEVSKDPATYTPYNGDDSTPPPSVLGWLDRDADDFNCTGSDGGVVLPLLSNRIDSSGISHHAWSLEASSGPGGYVIGHGNISFGSYPYLDQPLNEDVSKPMTITGSAPALNLSEPYQIRNETGTYLAVDVTNEGDRDLVEEFQVDFVVNGTSNVSSGVEELEVGESTTVALLFEQTHPGDLSLDTVVLSDDGIINGTSASIDMTVNLAIVDLVRSPTGDLNIDDNMILAYEIRNQGVYDATEVDINITYSEDGGPELLLAEQTIDRIDAGQTVFPSFVWEGAKSPGEKQTSTMEFTVTVNHGEFVAGGIPESDYSENTASTSTVFIDDRADLVLSPAVLPGGGSVANAGVAPPENASVGKTVDIGFTVYNTGLADFDGARLTMYLVEGTEREQIVNTTVTYDGRSIDVPADGNFSGTVQWKVDADPKDYTLESHINEFRTEPERDYDNNRFDTAFTVDPLEPRVTISTPWVVYDAGDAIVITGSAVNQHDSDQALAGETVTVSVLKDGNPVAQRSAETDSNGFYQVEIEATDDMAGAAELMSEVTVDGESATSVPLTITVNPATAITDQPIWVWLIIIAVIATILGAFSLYVYRYSLGKMAECGECHALIPESSRSCPNCGTDFETGTAKCSECSSWIPSDSSSCPECGATFIGSTIVGEEESDHMQQRREAYEAFLGTYREAAKEEMGRKFSEPKFKKWWKSHPEYISFEDWLARDEGEKVEKTISCPDCGSPNVVGSKNCHRCGHVFGKGDEPEVARRVVRREEAEKKPEIRTGEPQRKKVVVKRKPKEPEEGAEEAAEPKDEGEKDSKGKG